MPRTFEFPTRAVDFWIPLQFAPADYVYNNPYLQSIARLKQDVSLAQARAEMQRIALEISLSSRQTEDGNLTAHIPKELVVKSSVVPASLVPSIRAIVGRADPEQPISDVQLLADIVNAETAPRKVQVRVLGAFAGIAFLLAGIGLHGLLAYNVSQRAREIGVRVALGAEHRSILVMVFRRGLHLAVLGIFIGAALSVAAGRALQAVLAGVSPTDATTFGGAVGLAILMTMAGSLLPALRATRVDPLQVMRSD